MKSKRNLIVLLLVLSAVVGSWILLWGPETGAQTNSEAGTSQSEEINEGSDLGQGYKQPGDDIATEDPTKRIDSEPQAQMPPVRDSKVEGSPVVSNTEEATEILQTQKEKLGLGQNSEFDVRSHSSDEYGNTYYHVQQTYKGLRIFGLHANLEVERGRASNLSGFWLKNLDLDITPAYSADEALRKALDERGVSTAPIIELLGEPELLVFLTDQGAKLSWLFSARVVKAFTPLSNYIVDAHTPQIYLEQAVSHQ